MNNGDNKIRYEMEQLLSTNEPVELTKGCKVLDDYAGFKYIVFDDGTVVEKDWEGRVRNIEPSVRYGGIKLFKKVIPLDGDEVRTVYNVGLVRDHDLSRWFIDSLPARVADGQITSELAAELKDVVRRGSTVSDTVKFSVYAGHSNGYLYHGISLSDGKVRPVPVHMIISMVFNGLASENNEINMFMAKHNHVEKFLVVNHKNSFRLDNAACNLEWVTSKLNAMHGSFMAAGNGVQQYEGETLGFKFVEFSNKSGTRTGKYFVSEKMISAFDVYDIIKKNYDELRNS